MKEMWSVSKVLNLRKGFLTYSPLTHPYLQLKIPAHKLIAGAGVYRVSNSRDGADLTKMEDADLDVDVDKREPMVG
jgi:hypothetical protein